MATMLEDCTRGGVLFAKAPSEPNCPGAGTNAHRPIGAELVFRRFAFPFTKS